MMMSIDIAALGAAPSLDAECASADTPAGAAEAFAALLDEAADATRESDAPAPPRTSEDGEENFDELAALAMTSLLSIGATMQPVTEAGDGDEIAAAGTAGTEITPSEMTDLAAVSMSSQLPTPTTTIGNDMGVDSNDALVMTDAAFDASASQTAPGVVPETTPESASTDAGTTKTAPVAPQAAKIAAAAVPIAETTAADVDVNQAVTAALAGKAAVEARPAAKAARSSTPLPGTQGNASQKADGFDGNVVPTSSPASAAETIDATRASARTPPTADGRTSGSTAARFARALERAAAAATSETTGGAAAAANASTDGGGQPSGSGDSTPDRAAQFSAAIRQSGPNVLAFTVNGPVPIDTRAMAAAVANAAGHAETASIGVPERDVVAQLVQSMRVQFRDGIGEAVVKLKPEHLGSVQISLRIENGAIKATVQAESPAVRQWLESQQDTLRSSLADQGLRLERFVVQPDGERRASEDPRERQEQRRRPRPERPVSEKDHPIFEVTV